MDGWDQRRTFCVQHKTLIPSVKRGGGSVIVWTCFFSRCTRMACHHWWIDESTSRFYRKTSRYHFVNWSLTLTMTINTVSLSKKFQLLSSPHIVSFWYDAQDLWNFWQQKPNWNLLQGLKYFPMLLCFTFSLLLLHLKINVRLSQKNTTRSGWCKCLLLYIHWKEIHYGRVETRSLLSVALMMNHIHCKNCHKLAKSNIFQFVLRYF